MVAAHRVQSDLHDLLLLFLSHHFTALVMATVGAHVMRQHGLFASFTILNLYGLEVQMTAPLALAGV
jgi:hypothetical protein